LGLWRAPLQQTTDQVVVLAQVLAHAENLGYEEYRNLHLVAVNGCKVQSLRHFQELVDECCEPFLRLEFAPKNRIVVLDVSRLRDVTEEICEEHAIQQAYFLPTEQHEDDHHQS
jgi:hypothetical protein